MTSLKLVFVIGLIGVLSPITAQNVSSRVREAEEAEEPDKRFLGLATEIADAAISTATQIARVVPCLGSKCSVRLDFSPSDRGREKRAETKVVGIVNLSDEKDKRYVRTSTPVIGQYVTTSGRQGKDKFDYGYTEHQVVAPAIIVPDGSKVRETPKTKVVFRETPKRKVVFREVHASQNASLGVALISSYSEGPICTGVHLNSWTLLAVGDCLFGRRVDDIYVLITLQLADGSLSKVVADVESITYSPGYSWKKESNIAIVRIYGSIDWNVEYFELPRIDTSASNIVYKRLMTYTNEWRRSAEDYDASYVPAILHLNYFVCGMSPVQDGSYCVESKGHNEVFKKLDVGCPLFYKIGQIKKLLGMYMGVPKEKGVRAYLFHPTHPYEQWLDDFMYTHPLPPDYAASPRIGGVLDEIERNVKKYIN